MAVYSWNLNDVISKFPPQKILSKIPDFQIQTAPPAKDLIIAADALEEFKRIAKENDSSIGYIRKITYYTDEQKAINVQITKERKYRKIELYKKITM